VKPPLLLTESPYLQDTLGVGDLHPELEVVAVRIGRRGIAPHHHPAGARGSAIRRHAGIIFQNEDLCLRD
jgi:hypothetical protein